MADRVARHSVREEIQRRILSGESKAGERLSNVERDTIGELQRLSFALTTTKTRHERLRLQLHAEPAIDAVLTFRDPEED